MKRKASNSGTRTPNDGLTNYERLLKHREKRTAEK